MSSLLEGDFTEKEKITILGMFSKLDKFYNPLFEANDENLLYKNMGIKV